MSANPFKPRAGRTPPTLAGRDDELKALKRAAHALARGEDGDEQVWIAPRGYGKTALLNAFEDYLIENQHRLDKKNIRTLFITSSQMTSREELLHTLSSPETGEVVRQTGGGVSIMGVGGTISHETRIAPTTAVQHLLKAKRTILIVDEGASLRPNPTQTLLNAVQMVNRRSAQVMLVIAGTPDTEHALNQASATFWDKAKHMRLDLLPMAARQRAIEEPLAKVGIHMEPDALLSVANESHGYPPFVQWWGKCLYEHADRTGRTWLTVDDLGGTVRSQFERARDMIYEQRIGELDRPTMAAALGVARAFRDAGEGDLREGDLWTAIDNAFPHPDVTEETKKDAYRALKYRGFIWRPKPDATAGYQRGIPSLVEYTLQRALQRAPKTQSALNPAARCGQGSP